MKEGSDEKDADAGRRLDDRRFEPGACRASPHVVSLRGDQPLDAKATAPDRRRQVTDDEGFKRDWKEQPPLIPHKVDKDQITH